MYLRTGVAITLDGALLCNSKVLLPSSLSQGPDLHTLTAGVRTSAVAQPAWTGFYAP